MNSTAIKNRLSQSSHEQQQHLARQWIEDALQVRIPSPQLDSYLRDGVYLCKLINRIWPAFKLAVNYDDSIPAWRQNIQQFLHAAGELGLEGHQLFSVADLMEGKSMDAVASTLMLLWDASLKRPGHPNEMSSSHQLGDQDISSGVAPSSSSPYSHGEFLLRINPSPSPQEDQPPCERSDGQSPVSSVDSGYAKSQHNNTNPSFDHHSMNTATLLDGITTTRTVGESSASSRLGKFATLSFTRRFSSSRHKVPFHIRYQEWIDSKGEDNSNNSHDLPISAPPSRSTSSPLTQHYPGEHAEEKWSQQQLEILQTRFSTLAIMPGTITTLDKMIRNKDLRRKSLGMIALDEQENGRKYLDLTHPDGSVKTRYKLGNAIGKGHFGTVYRALDLMTGETVAIKRVKLESMEKTEVDDAMLEAELLQTLDHPNIVKYVGLIRTEDFICMVLEYVENGSLAKTLKTFESFPEHLVADYCVQILHGLAYLHDRCVVHCDLKAANILTTKLGDVKLSDFGVSMNLHLKEATSGSVTGTPNWMAPEVISLDGASTKSDIWSLGCTVVELYTGRPPYAGMNPMSVMYHVVKDECPSLPSTLSPELFDFLRLCFRKNPDDRPTAMELLVHPWITRNAVSGPKEHTITPDVTISNRSRAMLMTFPVRTPYSPVLDSDDEMLPLAAHHHLNTVARFDKTTEDHRKGKSVAGTHRFVGVAMSLNGILENGIHRCCKVCQAHIDHTWIECEVCDIVCHEDCVASALPCYIQQTNDHQPDNKSTSSQKWLKQTRRLSRVFSTKSRNRHHDAST